MRRSGVMRMSVLLVAVLLGSAWAGQPEGAPMKVIVSIAPHAYLVERIGGKYVDVQTLVAPGQEPHTFAPTPKQMMAVAGARRYFVAGMPFERRLVHKVKGASRELIVIDLSEGIATWRAASSRKGHADDHGHGEAQEGHDGRALDPHIWLSPRLLAVQAKAVAMALRQADPMHASDYSKQLKTLLGDIEATDARVRKVLAPFKGQSFFVFHPAFGYFGDAYGLRQEAVELEGKSPTPKQLAALIAKARRQRVRIIFVQPQFDSRSVRAVAEAIGGAVVPMDPLAKDVLGNFEVMASEIQRALHK